LENTFSPGSVKKSREGSRHTHLAKDDGPLEREVRHRGVLLEFLVDEVDVIKGRALEEEDGLEPEALVRRVRKRGGEIGEKRGRWWAGGGETLDWKYRQISATHAAMKEGGTTYETLGAPLAPRYP
jgi:hypothetical protein